MSVSYKNEFHQAYGKCKCKCPERLIILFSSSRYFFQIPIPVRTDNAGSTIYRYNRIIVKRNKRNRNLFYKRVYIFRIKFFPPCPIGVQVDITRMMTVDGFNLLHQFAQTRQIIHFRFILQMIGIQSRMIHHRFYNLFGSSRQTRDPYKKLSFSLRSSVRRQAPSMLFPNHRTIPDKY